MESNNLIDTYLLNRGLWNPTSGIKKGEANDIFENEDKLAKVAGLFDTFGEALGWILEEKIKVMALDIIRNADPREVPIIRQNMIDVADIWDEAQKYSIEYRKRQEASAGSGESTPPNEDNVLEQPPPEPVAGEL